MNPEQERKVKNNEPPGGCSLPHLSQAEGPAQFPSALSKESIDESLKAQIWNLQDFVSDLENGARDSRTWYGILRGRDYSCAVEMNKCAEALTISRELLDTHPNLSEVELIALGSAEFNRRDREGLGERPSLPAPSQQLAAEVSFETVKAVLNSPGFEDRMGTGAPRPGHAEGTLGAHIGELAVNLLNTTIFNLKGLGRDEPKINQDPLIVLILVHDSFKSESVPGVAITDPRSHASLARAFLSQLTDNQDILEMVQRHDEPYALFKNFKQSGEVPVERLNSMLNAIKDLDTFLLFQVIDNTTESKLSNPANNHLPWFFDVLKEQGVPLVRDYIRTSEYLAASFKKPSPPIF